MLIPEWLRAMFTPEWLQAFAVVMAAIAAWRGFSAWRHELVGKKRYELAEEVLTLFYEAASVIQEMRTYGLTEQMLLSDVPLEGKQGVEEAIQRFQKERQATLAKLQASRFRFAATFSTEYEAAFRTFDEVGQDVRFSAAKIVALEKEPQPGHLTIHELEKLRPTYKPRPNDEIERRIKEAVKPIEEVCWKELRGPKSFWSWWCEWAKPPDL